MGICITAVSEVALRKCEVFQFSGLNWWEKSKLELIWKNIWREFKSTRNIFLSGILIKIKNEIPKKMKRKKRWLILCVSLPVYYKTNNYTLSPQLVLTNMNFMPLIVRLRSTGVSTPAFSPIETLLKKKPNPTKKAYLRLHWKTYRSFLPWARWHASKQKKEKNYLYWHHIHRREGLSQSDTAQCWSLLHPCAPFEKQRESMTAKSRHSNGLCSL